MTAAELEAFAAEVRAECDAALGRLATVDPESLPPDLRAEYEAQRDGWREFRALTEAGALDVHVLACLYAGRELTQAEAAALVRKQ